MGYHSAAVFQSNSCVVSIDIYELSLTAAALCPPSSLRMPNRMIEVSV